MPNSLHTVISYSLSCETVKNATQWRTFTFQVNVAPFEMSLFQQPWHNFYFEEEYSPFTACFTKCLQTSLQLPSTVNWWNQPQRGLWCSAIEIDWNPFPLWLPATSSNHSATSQRIHILASNWRPMWLRLRNLIGSLFLKILNSK